MDWFGFAGASLVIYGSIKLFLFLSNKSRNPKPTVKSSGIKTTETTPLYEKMFWGGWSRDVHYLYAQRDIAEKWNDINPDNFNTDTNSQTGTFGKFRVSLVSCTCKQFLSRRLPCKHMYYLADDLGFSFPSNDSSYARIDHEDFDNWVNQNKTFKHDKYIDDDDPPEYWGGWSPAIHKLQHQQERISRMVQNEDYETTLRYCTCMDFRKRRLPCKHMYRLAVELKLPV